MFASKASRNDLNPSLSGPVSRLRKIAHASARVPIALPPMIAA
jgi:hypothetical protein